MNEQRLVVAARGQDELGVLVVEPLEPLLEGGEPEEVVLLLLPIELDLVDRAAIPVLDLVLGLEVRAPRAVPPLVGPEVDVTGLVDPPEDSLDALDVLGVARSDEEVVRDLEPLGHVAKARRVAVGELARRDPEPLRRLRDRLAVLVRAGEEEDVLAALAHVAGEHVARDRGVGVPEMGLGVHVVDRRRDVVAHRESSLTGCGACPAAIARRPSTGRDWTPPGES